jgi:hypothetical protein
LILVPGLQFRGYAQETLNRGEFVKVYLSLLAPLVACAAQANPVFYTGKVVVVCPGQSYSAEYVTVKAGKHEFATGEGSTFKVVSVPAESCTVEAERILGLPAPGEPQ